MVTLLGITIRTDAEFAQNDNYSNFQSVQIQTENKSGEKETSTEEGSQGRHD